MSLIFFLSLSLSFALSLFLSCTLRANRFMPVVSLVSSGRPRSTPPRAPKYRRTLPSFPSSLPPLLCCDRCASDPPTLAVMHYETRNDESAYVSHVMEIPLLIRALNDSATAGYITRIITLTGGRGGNAQGVRDFALPPFFSRFAGSDVFVIIDR